MFIRTKLCVASLLALGGSLAAPTLVFGQSAERIEITGSAIKRIDAETAVPLTIFRMDELKQQGITTVEQVLSNISGLQTTLGTSQAVGASTGGASFADLRGIGPNKTLILLNGRRIANNAFDSSAPDLNMIPFAALERVEVLRDGASALYGTDAIGGVINFITRRDYSGGSITLGFDSPQHAGGKSANANIGLGFGNLDTNGFNIFGFADFQKQKNVTGIQRNFNKRIAGGLSGSTSPANYYQTGNPNGTPPSASNPAGTPPNPTQNPSAPTCAAGTFLIPAGDNTSCFMTTSSFVDYVPKSERASAMLKGTLKLGADNQLSAEYFATRSRVWTVIAPVPYGLTVQNRLRPDGTANPYYPGNSGSGFTPPFPLDPTFDDGSVGETVVDGGVAIQPGFVYAKWRDLPNGPRGDRNTNTQQRFVLSLDGSAAGWDYQAGLTYNQNKVDEKLISGYNDGNKILEGILEGTINPYGAQDAAGTALLDNALAVGTVLFGKGTVSAADARASRELGDWFGAGRAAALAVGGEYRREKFTQQANTSYAEIVVASTGIDPATFNSGSRNIYALYGELNVPIMKTLDVTAAVRYDKYSDFGNTTNPKISFRFQPTTQVLLRGAYTTGFRAPSLFDLNAAQSYTNTPQVNDPVTCPNGVATGSPVNNCKTQFQSLSGGNPALEPEKSKSLTFGIVLEPMADVSVGADLWWIRLTNQIGSLAASTAFDPANLATFGGLFHRVNGRLSTDGTECPGANCGYVDLRTQNLGDLNTNGVDFNANYRMRTGLGRFTVGYNSTWIQKYEYQDYTNGPWNQNVGIFSGTAPIFRWQHNLGVTWNLGEFSAGVTGHYKSGYSDEDPSNKVSPYATMDVFGTWLPMKALSLTAGVRNLTDREPPFSNQVQTFQAGYDPRFTDPSGRTYYVRGTYNF